MNSDPPSTAAEPGLFRGRRRGPGLTPRKQELLRRLLPVCGVARPAAEPGALQPQTLFGRPMRGFALEIGFGKGEHLLAQAMRRPDFGHIGCEPFVNGVAALLDGIEAQGLDTIRIYPDDALHLLVALPDHCLDTVWLIHPDPWPKTRHRKRRFVAPERLDLLARVLRPGGELVMVTDHPLYRRWTAMQLALREDFRWTATRPADWRTPHEGWSETRYADKAAREGRHDTFFRYTRA